MADFSGEPIEVHRMLASWVAEPISDEDARGLDVLESPGAVTEVKRG